MSNILFIITKAHIGGAQKWTKEQMDVCEPFFDCHLATNENNWLSKNSKFKNILLNDLIEKKFSIRYLIILYKYIKKNKINTIVASSANAGIYARLIKFFPLKVKVIYVSHGWSAVYNGGVLKFFYVFIEKLLSYPSDSILCISKYDYDVALNVIRIKKYKLKYIENSIFPVVSVPSVQKRDTVRILTVTRLSPPKRVDLLIGAVKNLNIELHIVGTGELLDGLKKTASKNIFFHGEIQGFNEFNKFDMFCLISESEGLPLSALEAMSCGLPLILSDVGGCSELIFGNGSLVKNRVDEIERAIISGLNEIEHLGVNSIELYDKKFNLHNQKNKYVDYYRN